MKDFDWKIWLVIGALALGGLFELLKSFPGSKRSASNWSFDLFDLGTGSSPYNIHGQKSKRGLQAKHNTQTATQTTFNRQASPELQAFVAANAPKATEFNHEGKGAEGKAEEKKAEAEEFEYYVDSKTGKLYRRKKKKKPEDKEVKTAMEDPLAQTSEPEKKELPKQDDNINTTMEQAISYQMAPPPASQKVKPFASLEEWISKLLNHPDLAETRRFIDAYQRNLVTADVFYKIVKMMLEDSRLQMKELGVLCAGQTYSVLSFQYLADISKNIPTSENLRRYADGFINNYSDLQNLSILERVMRSPNQGYATLLATKKLEQSAQKYLVTTEPNPDPNQGPGPGTQNVSASSNASYFQRFLSVLENLVASPDSEIAQQANTTLNDLRERLNIPRNQADTSGPGETPPDQAAFQQN